MTPGQDLLERTLNLAGPLSGWRQRPRSSNDMPDEAHEGTPPLYRRACRRVVAFMHTDGFLQLTLTGVDSHLSPCRADVETVTQGVRWIRD